MLTEKEQGWLDARRERERVDPLYELLPKFILAKTVDIPTVNLNPEDVDELRRLLVDWDTGGPTEGVIIERYALEDGADS